MNKKTHCRDIKKRIIVGLLLGFLIGVFVLIMLFSSKKFDPDLHDCLVKCPQGFSDCRHELYGESSNGCLKWKDKSQYDLFMNKDCGWLRWEVAKCEVSGTGWTIYACDEEYMENLWKVYKEKCLRINNRPPKIISIENEEKINHSEIETNWTIIEEWWNKKFNSVYYNQTHDPDRCHQVTCDCFEEFGCMAYCYECDEDEKEK